MLLDLGLGREFGRTMEKRKGKEIKSKCVQIGPGNQCLHVGWQSQSGYIWTGINWGFGWTSLLSGNHILSWPTDDHWRWWISQREAPGSKRFPVTHSATKEPRQVVPDRFTRQKNSSENSYTKFRGFCTMTTTSGFWSNLPLVFMIDLLQHYLKGFMQPCLRVNHGNYQEQKSFPQ